MEKYIIDLYEDWIDGEYLRLPARIAGTLQWVKTKTALTPYTEDSTYAHGYTEAESKYREIRDELEKQAYQRGYETAKHECEDCQKIRADAEQELVKKAYDTAYADAEEIYESGKRAMYQKGLKDAWEAARKIVSIPTAELHTMFDKAVYYDTVFRDCTASEAIEKIRQYEQEKEELGIQGYFKKGEEVIDADGTKAVILRVSENNYCQVYTEKGCIENWHIHTYKFHKTGRTFPEIAEVLQKMKENNDNK